MYNFLLRVKNRIFASNVYRKTEDVPYAPDFALNRIGGAKQPFYFILEHFYQGSPV